MGWFGLDDPDIDVVSCGVNFPLDPRPEFELFGYSNFNDGHQTDLYDALEAETVKQNERSLYYALKADELVAGRAMPAVTAHNHNTEKTLIDWLPALKMGGSNGIAGATSQNGQAVIDVTSFKAWGWGVLVIPSGHIVRPVLFPKARGSLTTHANRLTVKIEIFEGVSGASPLIGTTPIYKAAMQLDATITSQDRVWFEGSPIQLVGLTTFPAINSKRLLYVKISVMVNTGQGVLWEVELAWRYGL